MSNAKLASVEFEVLDATGKNFLTWQVDVKLHLKSLGLSETIATPPQITAAIAAPPAGATPTAAQAAAQAALLAKKPTSMDRAKALIFIRRHVDKTLKSQYLTVEDPHTLWMALEERFKHQKDVWLPRARYEWEHLRLQDFQSVAAYNSALFNITSRLELCGEPVTQQQMLEKTFTSFHEKDVILMQQYRERNFQRYSELLNCLLMAEQNKELLLEVHNKRPTGAAPLPESHKVTHNQAQNKKKNNQPYKGKGPRKQQARGRNKQQYKQQNKQPAQQKKNFTWRRTADRPPTPPPKKRRTWEDACHKCGMEGHWSGVCRTPRHLQELYQEKGKRKVETNVAHYEGPTKFSAEDFENDDLLD